MREADRCGMVSELDGDAMRVFGGGGEGDIHEDTKNSGQMLLDKLLHDCCVPRKPCAGLHACASIAPF